MSAVSAPSAEPVEQYQRTARTIFSPASLRKRLETFQKLRVAVVGDVIIDEYCYVRVAGTVTKYPVVSAVYQDLRQMAGGGAVIARHCRQFARDVTYVGAVGDQDKNGQFLKRKLKKEKVNARLVQWTGSHTIAKRRFLTGGYPSPLAAQLGKPATSSLRLFELGMLPRAPMPVDVESQVVEQVERACSSADLTILADFGHGTVTPAVAQAVQKKSSWWAVNAQTNSTNYGFNRITKYRSADYVCIDELEARLPSGDKVTPIEGIARDLRATTGADALMITRGSDGMILFESRKATYAPAIASKVVDTVGAGDAVLALSALARRSGANSEETVFIGAAAGAVASSIVGNEDPVRRNDLERFATGWLHSPLTAK